MEIHTEATKQNGSKIPRAVLRVLAFAVMWFNQQQGSRTSVWCLDGHGHDSERAVAF